MRINNNVVAQTNNRQLNINNNKISKGLEKLSSGRQLNRAGDNAAGLAISEKMRTQILGMNKASRNTQDAISLIQTAEGALQSTSGALQRMRELAVQSASDTNSPEDRQKLQSEFSALIAEIDDTAAKTEFNGIPILNGNVSISAEDDLAIQSGPNTGDDTAVRLGNMSAESLGVASADITTQQSATESIAAIDAAIDRLSAQRSELGAMQNRLEFKMQNLEVSSENLAAAESRIADTDMAKMMTELTKNKILSQASFAIGAQANAIPQGIVPLMS